MAAYTPPVIPARVQWWDDSKVHIRCPICDEIHDHDFDGTCTNRNEVVASCEPIQKGNRAQRYWFAFPPGYEIDKETFRFVAGEELTSGRKVLKNGFFQWRRDSFRDKLNGKQKWENAPEDKTKLMRGTPSLMEINIVIGHMVRGNLDFVQRYFETSSNSKLFLHGVSPLNEDWNSAGMGERGQTALHIAASRPFPKIVELLLSKGADVNATDIDGVTPLMEAALWGQLENVKKLLKYNADKTLQSIEEDRIMLAIEYALPTIKNSQFRYKRVGGPLFRKLLRMEEAYIRDLDRTSIVCLLDDSEKPSYPHLDTFAFQRAPLNFLSLTTEYTLPGRKKTIARLHRGHGLPDISAMSGWSDEEHGGVDIFGETWTDVVLKLCKQVCFQPRPIPYKDGGVPGKHHACHAEKQLVAYFVDKHSFLDLRDNGQSQDDITQGMERLTVDEIDEWAEKLKKLEEACPDKLLREGIIMSSRPVCKDCENFVEKVNKKLGLKLKVFG